jgi:hypothetical protein
MVSGIAVRVRARDTIGGEALRSFQNRDPGRRGDREGAALPVAWPSCGLAPRLPGYAGLRRGERSGF